MLSRYEGLKRLLARYHIINCLLICIITRFNSIACILRHLLRILRILNCFLKLSIHWSSRFQAIIVCLTRLIIGVSRVGNDFIRRGNACHIRAGQLIVAAVALIREALHAYVLLFLGEIGVGRALAEVVLHRYGFFVREGVGYGVAVGFERGVNALGAVPLGIAGKVFYKVELIDVPHLRGLIGRLGLVHGLFQRLQRVGTGAFFVAAGSIKLILCFFEVQK